MKFAFNSLNFINEIKATAGGHRARRLSNYAAALMQLSNYDASALVRDSGRLEGGKREHCGGNRYVRTTDGVRLGDC